MPQEAVSILEGGHNLEVTHLGISNTRGLRVSRPPSSLDLCPRAWAQPLRHHHLVTNLHQLAVRHTLCSLSQTSQSRGLGRKKPSLPDMYPSLPSSFSKDRARYSLLWQGRPQAESQLCPHSQTELSLYLNSWCPLWCWGESRIESRSPRSP